jgi:hypothetical protein
MAKKVESLASQEANKREELLALLKAKMPATFEREPAPAFAEGNLNALVDAIIAL